MKNEHWYELDMLPEGKKTNELKQYHKILGFLWLNDEQNIILKDNHVVITRVLKSL